MAFTSLAVGAVVAWIGTTLFTREDELRATR